MQTMTTYRGIRGTVPQYRGEWSASRIGWFTPG